MDLNLTDCALRNALLFLCINTAEAVVQKVKGQPGPWPNFGIQVLWGNLPSCKKGRAETATKQRRGLLHRGPPVLLWPGFFRDQVLRNSGFQTTCNHRFKIYWLKGLNFGRFHVQDSDGSWSVWSGTGGFALQLHDQRCSKTLF